MPAFGAWSDGAATSIAALATADVELSAIAADSALVLDVDVDVEEVRDSFGISIDSTTLRTGSG